MPLIDDVLRDSFGLSQFRPHQRAIIEDTLAGQDVVCVMPTGAGKSLCFQLPAVMMQGLTVVVSPLIALMADQVEHLRRRNLPVLFLNSSQRFVEQSQVYARLRAGFSGLLYVAPERFPAPSFQRLLPLLRAKFFVVDEAHCLSFWGHDFRPEYMRLAEVRRALGSPTTMALTATATPQVRKDIVEMLGLRSPKMHVTGFDRPNLSYSSRRIEREGDKDAALALFLATHTGTGIVYCSTRRAVEELAALLEERFPQRTVCAYHAGMTPAQRKRSQELFMQRDDAVVVATNAFGMGINKPTIRFVVHYNLPGSVEAYYQEAGRAGRDGAPAKCLLYFSTRDLKTQEFFINNIGDNNPELARARGQALADEFAAQARPVAQVRVRPPLPASRHHRLLRRNGAGHGLQLRRLRQRCPRPVSGAGQRDAARGCSSDRSATAASSWRPNSTRLSRASRREQRTYPRESRPTACRQRCTPLTLPRRAASSASRKCGWSWRTPRSGPPSASVMIRFCARSHGSHLLRFRPGGCQRRGQ